jgi:hypothetical protein
MYYRSGNTFFDQVSLVEALFRSSCRVLSLDQRWNNPDRKQLHQCYILHYKYRILKSLAYKLIQLDNRIYGNQSKSSDIGDIDMASFIREHQSVFRRKIKPGIFKRNPFQLFNR